MQTVYTSLRLLALLVLLPVALFAQADNPCNADVIGATPTPFSNLSNSSATVETAEISISGVFEASSHTVWFKFFAPPNGTMTISTCDDADFDTELAVFTVSDCADFGTYTEIDNNDDASGCTGNRSRLELTSLTPGAEYYLAIDGYNGDSGDFGLVLSTTAPDNDLPCSATAISLISQQGLTEGFTNQGATSDPGEDVIYPSNLDGESGSVWFYFDAPNSGEVTVTNCDAATFDSEFTVFTLDNCGDYGTYTFVDQNDDNCDELESGVELTGLTAGQRYYLAVDGYDESAGNFGLNFSAPTPDNDLPCNAIALPVDGSTQTGFTNIDATMSASEGEDAIYPQNITASSGTVWFSFEAPPSGAMSISNCGMADFDTEFTLFSATDCADYSTFTFVAQNDDAVDCPGNNSFLDLTDLSPGATYHLAVDGFSSNSGNFDLTLTAVPISSVDAFAAAGRSVSIYPNPTNGLFQLRVLQERVEALDVNIMDVTGRSLLHRHYGQPGSEMTDEIDVRHLAAGIYMVRVSSGNTMKVERLIIN